MKLADKISQMFKDSELVYEVIVEHYGNQGGKVARSSAKHVMRDLRRLHRLVSGFAPIPEEYVKGVTAVEDLADLEIEDTAFLQTQVSE